MSPARQVRSLVLLSVLALTGCMTARVVSRDTHGGVVAIPENSNRWPWRYRDNAIALIKEDSPDYVILEEFVVTGTETTDRELIDTRTEGPNPRVGYNLMGSETMRTPESRDRTEWRITYRKPTPLTTTVETAPRQPPPIGP
jgi:hypothetical protein